MTSTSTTLSLAENGARDQLDTEITHGAIGTGTPGSNSLGNEVFRDTIDNTSLAQGQVNKQLIIAATEANGNTISEAGSFNDATTGDMLQSNTFTATTKTNEIELFIDYQLTFTATET